MSVPTFSRIRQARELPGSLVSFIALWLVISSGVTFGVDIITGGKTYRSVEVVSINGDTVTFTSRQGEISVSRKKLSWVEEAKVAEYEKKVSGRNPHEELRDDSLDPRKMQRVWVLGPVGAQKENGITVNSSRYFIQSRSSRSDAKETKNGAPILTGLIFVRDVRKKPESQFDSVLWRDGFEVVDGFQLPAFSTSDPGVVPLPDLADERVWTNTEGKEVTARLRSVTTGKGNFTLPDGSPFVYEIEKLIEEDRAFIEKGSQRMAEAGRVVKNASIPARKSLRYQSDFLWWDESKQSATISANSGISVGIW